MAYDELLADRIRQILNDKKVSFSEKKEVWWVVFFSKRKNDLGCLVR
jgi:dsDNA-binding SOS-regulon protein